MLSLTNDFTEPPIGVLSFCSLDAEFFFKQDDHLGVACWGYLRVSKMDSRI